MALPLRSSIVR